MKSNNNELAIVKNSIFMLLCKLERNLTEHINKDKIDSQAIFALTKLVDSFIKISHSELILGERSKDDNLQQQVSDEDRELITQYKNVSNNKMAPRAGLEPATERLTAVCSTTELPGN